MRYSIIQGADKRFHVVDTWCKSLYGAYRTQAEATKAATVLNSEREEQKSALAKCGMMLSD